MLDVVAEENQEECLGIQDQASGEVMYQWRQRQVIVIYYLYRSCRVGLGMYLVTKN